MTPAGDKRRRLRTERRAAGDDGYGNSSGAFETLIEARLAKVTPTRGGEQIIAGRLAGTSAFDIRIAIDPETITITVGDRLVDEDDETRIFNVRWAEDFDGKGRELLIQAETGEAT